MTQLKKLNYLQWEALIMVMGEKSFLAGGPIGAYGPFMNQINVQQAAYLFILAIGDLNNIRGIARRISGQAALDILNMRVRMAKKVIDAQERDELGLLRHLRKWAESKGLKNEELIRDQWNEIEDKPWFADDFFTTGLGIYGFSLSVLHAEILERICDFHLSLKSSGTRSC